MKRESSFFLVMLAAILSTATVSAQQSVNDANPLYRATSIRTGTIILPPIPDEPFSATALIQDRQVLSDGSVSVTRNVNLICRDSQGRTHGEMRPRMPDSDRGMPPLSEVHIYDPQTGVKTTYTIASHVATRQIQFRHIQTDNTAITASPGVEVEDLGSKIIDDIEARGTRRTVLVPAAIGGTGVPMKVFDEFWYSEQLHVNLLLIHNDPRLGVHMVSLTNIKREEPDPSFFEVPEGYKIVDVTPTEDSPAGRVLERAGRPTP